MEYVLHDKLPQSVFMTAEKPRKLASRGANSTEL